jgi:hypothetical protein
LLFFLSLSLKCMEKCSRTAVHWLIVRKKKKGGSGYNVIAKKKCI